MRAMQADGVVVAHGDMVYLHTGFAQRVLEMGGTPDAHVLEHACAVLDGTDAWITDSGLAVLCADNYAVEAFPAARRAPIAARWHRCTSTASSSWAFTSASCGS